MKMRELFRVGLTLNGLEKALILGIPDTEELEEIYKYRYNVYLERGHICENPDNMDMDAYDAEGACDYFVAAIDDQIIGHIRLIRADPLPTEKYFSFNSPPAIAQINNGNKVEIGRLIASKYDERMPRHLTMICLIKSIVIYAKEVGYEGGFAHLRTNVVNRLKKVQAPFVALDDVLFSHDDLKISGDPLDGYYKCEEDPVKVISFLYSDFQEWIDLLFDTSGFFMKNGGVNYKLAQPLV